MSLFRALFGADQVILKKFFSKQKTALNKLLLFPDEIGYNSFTLKTERGC